MSLTSELVAAWFKMRNQDLFLQVLVFFLSSWSLLGWKEVGHLDDDVDGGRAHGSCRGCCSVPGPLQTVQRAEPWCVILALQAASAVHLGVDNLYVVRHVGRLLDGNFGPYPAELVNDGDLIVLINEVLDMRLVFQRSRDMLMRVWFGMVVRELDRIGNNAADEVADFGRRRVEFPVIDARRNFAGGCGRWYPVILESHRFFIAISGAVVNHDGGNGTAPDPFVWSAGALPKRRERRCWRRQLCPQSC